MRTDTGLRQGGFVQNAEIPSSVGGCCGESQAADSAGCCGEPVAGQATDTAQGGCCGEPIASGAETRGCCGDAIRRVDQHTAEPERCCG